MIILEIVGVASTPDTDHAETDMMKIGCVVEIRGHVVDDEPEEIFKYGLSPRPEGMPLREPDNPGDDPEVIRSNERWVREALQSWLAVDGNDIDPWVYNVTNDDINRERTRRKELGISFNGVYLRGEPDDRENLTNLYNIAQARLAQGDNTTTTNFMDGNNILHQLIPQEMVDCYFAGLQYIDALYNASWAIKAMDRADLDYENDNHWPSNGLS